MNSNAIPPSALKTLALAFLCVGAATAAPSTQAAQPAATPGATRPGTPVGIAAAPQLPGKLTALSAPATVSMNTEKSFSFSGKGHCKLKLDSGDGASDFEGELPFVGKHSYSSASMSSFVAFKNYNATVTPSGNCKTSGAGPFTVQVQVINPHPQSAGAPPQGNTATMAGSGKLDTSFKPGAAGTPVVPATIISMTASGKAMTGAPSSAAGSATVLTVNGTGHCKYHLSYVNLDAQGNLIMKAYPMMPKNSSTQSPFPMTMTMLPVTTAGTYKWTASGVEGCTGSANVTFTVQ